VTEKKASVTPTFETGKKNSLGNYKPLSHTSVPGKAAEQILQPFPNTRRTRRQRGTASRHLPKDESRLTILTALCDAMTSLVDGR